MTRERSHLETLSNNLRDALTALGLTTRGSTNIVPVIIGDDKKTVDLAALMQQKGYLIFGVRPPTVPERTSRFRLSLTANIEWSDIQEIPELISEAMSNI
jgi:8-amino-7-oxononanoate synthase